MSDEAPTPRRMAEIVAERYGSRLSLQEAAVFSMLVLSDQLVTYDMIREYLWTGSNAPMDTKRSIHVVVCHIREKVPSFNALGIAGKGYICTTELADVLTKSPD